MFFSPDSLYAYFIQIVVYGDLHYDNYMGTELPFLFICRFDDKIVRLKC